MRDVIYNNTRLNELLIIKEVKESILPDINNVSLRLNNSLGSRFIRQEMNPRVIEIDVEFIKDSLVDRQELIDKLAPLLFSKVEKDLTIDNVRTYKAIIDGSTNIDNIRYDGAFTMTFIANDPLAYGDNITLEFESEDSLVNNGNYKTRGQIEFTAEAPNVSVRLVDGETYDYVSIVNLSTGDDVVIDLENENVTVNGESVLQHMDPVGDFFDIPTGQFSIGLTGSSKATIIFTERWL